MACIGGRGDWIVPRKLMCFLFWTGTLLLFIGILLVVTSKHKGTVFLLWGAVLLGLGACILLVCLALCVHAYYVIAESRSSAEHSIIDHLQLQRKAQYSAPSCSSDFDGSWEPNVFPGITAGRRNTTTNSNGHCSTSEFRQGMLPVENGIHHHQSFPSGRGSLEDEKAEKGGRKSAESMTGSTGEPNGDNDPITRTFKDKYFSSPPSPPPANYSIPPPSYFSQFSPPYVSITSSKITSSSPAPFPVSLDQDSTSRAGSHQSDERSSRASVASAQSHLRASSATSVSKTTRADSAQQQQQYLHHRSPHPPRLISSDFRNNASSQSSAQNSSTELDPETTDDAEVNGGTLLPRRHAPHHRLLNNTPVNCYQTGDTTEGGAPDHGSLLLGRRPPRLNFEPTTYDNDSYDDHVDKGESASSATTWRKTPTTPYGNGPGVWTTEGDAILSGRPPQAGLRRPPGPSSITRPFGHGTVTVTPLYRAPKTPPSERHNTVAPEVTVRSPEAARNAAPIRGTVTGKSPELLRRGGMSEGAFGGGRTVPTVSVTPCVTDREIDISVCQSDVTLYDNVVDVVRM